ncbi:MAG: sulfatase [Bacteroidales bacterium]
MMNYKSAASILLSGLVVGGWSSENVQKEYPNIVWITSEDNSKHYMQIFDDNGARTPNIEKLAKSGLTFTRAFSNAPVCSAARSTLISGSYGPRTASHYHRRIKPVPMPESLEMFPSYLREAGYYTTNNHKEDYNFIKSDNVWDESSNQASWRNRREGQPFFHVFNIGITHEGQLHFSREQMESTLTKVDKDTVFVKPIHPLTETFKYTNAFYLDRIMSMDEQVGKVLNELENDGLLENTIVFYYGDHGGVLPGSKGYLTETGLHVPLVVYIPAAYRHLIDAEPGTSINGFVSFVDFGATVLNLAGIKIPDGMDGRPFLGRGIKLEEIDARDETYSYADRMDEKYDMVRAVRKGRYKYVRNYNPFNFDGLMNNYRYRQLAYREWEEMYRKGGLNEIQSAFFKPKEPEYLYDIESDPFETNNLAGDNRYSGIIHEMRMKLDVWQRNMPDLSFFPEFFLVKHAFDNPVEFGQKNKDRIHKYMDISNLMLSDYYSAGPSIRASLNSDDPWERYWGIIVCSSFGKSAGEMIPLLKQVAQTDPEYINRVRAAEFLAITGVEDPAPVMINALYQTRDENEALLILNSIVLMQDGYSGYSFDIQPERLAATVGEYPLVRDRLMYLELP